MPKRPKSGGVAVDRGGRPKVDKGGRPVPVDGTPADDLERQTEEESTNE